MGSARRPSTGATPRSDICLSGACGPRIDARLARHRRPARLPPRACTKGAADAQRAAARYTALVRAGRDVRLWDEGPRQQIYLGDEAFVEPMQALAEGARAASPEVPRGQRRAPLQLGPAGAGGECREQALLRAHVERGITMTALARGLGLSVSRVSRLIARAEAQRQNASALAVASGLAR